MVSGSISYVRSAMKDRTRVALEKLLDSTITTGEIHLFFIQQVHTNASGARDTVVGKAGGVLPSVA